MDFGFPWDRGPDNRGGILLGSYKRGVAVVFCVFLFFFSSNFGTLGLCCWIGLGLGLDLGGRIRLFYTTGLQYRRMWVGGLSRDANKSEDGLDDHESTTAVCVLLLLLFANLFTCMNKTRNRV